MGERERIAIFNMIGDEVEGAYVLDAYAGSGALGIEALSRGADCVLFIEKGHVASNTIDENLRDLYPDDEDREYGGVLCMDVMDAAMIATDRFDIIFADPPYDKYRPEMVECLVPLVTYGGLLVVSQPNIPPVLPGMELVTARKYAAARIAIYRKIDYDEGFDYADGYDYDDGYGYDFMS